MGAGSVLHDGMELVAKQLDDIPNSGPARLRVISDNPLYAPTKARPRK
jgi:hypothetical protein